ncbi:MAG: nucleotidyltransferase domain-containing protein [Nanoarchaeota archaeon]|nr:nucleotidyltransferase domain-containing protein [Nanoarchaeota archaeon]
MNNIKILKFLINNRNKEFSINQISKELNLNYRIAYQETHKLRALINIRILGNSKQCQFNNRFNYLILKTENERKEEILKNKNLNVINNELEKIKSPFYILLLFGSSVKENKKGSDIDLCLISDDKKNVEQLKQSLNWLPLKLHIIDFNTNEFKQMLNTKEDNVGKEILENNIILQGIEDFYRLLNFSSFM